MEMPRFRPATAADFPAICHLVTSAGEFALLHPAGQYPWSIEQLEKLAEERFDLTIMQSANTIIGFANLYGRVEQQHAFIGNVIIASSQRGHGHGRRLTVHMLERLFHTHQLPEAHISVFADNTPALHLYRSLGFSPYDEEMRTTAQGNEHKLLHLRLKNNA